MSQPYRRKFAPGRVGAIVAFSAIALLATWTTVFGGMRTPEPMPGVIAAVSNEPAAPQFAVGGRHVCALPGDGTVLCWGNLDVIQNEFGELGDGAVTDPEAPAGDVWVQHVVVADQASAAGGDCVDVGNEGEVIRCHGTASLTGVTAITAGYSHTCALLLDTTVKCWGANEAHEWSGDPIDPVPSYSGGAVGDGTSTIRPVPVTVIAGPGETGALSGVRTISAAAFYTCAVLIDNTAKCWGNAPQAASLAPITVMADGTQPLTDIASLATGDDMACAALLDGSVKCWGTGQLGDQLSDGRPGSTLPVTVTADEASTSALGGVASVAVANGVGYQRPNGDLTLGHSCALLESGGVSCWGYNDVSQLGAGYVGPSEANYKRDFAVPVVAGPRSSDGLTGVTALAAGGYFTCALIDDGSVKCWGLGYGGDGFSGAGAPVPLVGPRPAVAIAAGGPSVCVLLADGTLLCPGFTSALDPVLGLVITPPSPSPSSTPSPTAVALPSAVPTGSTNPGTAHVVDLAADCALFSDGSVACPLSVRVPAKPVAGITDATAISANGGEVCALRAGGGIVCWGLNTQGQLGNGTLANSGIPVPVSGVTDAIAISAGGLHTCAIRADGGAMCWGYNIYGQLGNGTSTSSSIPVAVSGITDATAIAAGGDVTCVIVTGGGVECWGSVRELGNGADPEFPTGSTAQPVSGLTDAVAIAAGEHYTCAVRVGGSVLCWGSLDPAQVIASGTIEPVLVPLAVPGISDATDVAAGLDHTCAIRSGGGVACWGTNEQGQLGIGTTTDSSTPVDVPGITDAIALTVDIGSTCALTSGGEVWCWGLGFESFLPVQIQLAAPVAPTSPPTAPTATPGGSSGPTAPPNAADVDGLAGDWTVTYTAGPTPVTIAFAAGQYSVTTKAGMRLAGSSCDLPPDTVTATFAGSHGSYSGQSGSWRSSDCSFLAWVPTTVKAEGDQLLAALANGGRLLFTRAVVPFRASVPTISQISLDPIILLQSLAIAAGFVLLIPFPGALFDSTLEANYAEVTGWGRSLRRRLSAPLRRGRTAPARNAAAQPSAGDGWRTLPLLGFALLFGTLLGCLLDPTFGFSLTSLATFIGVLGGVMVTMLVFAVPLLLAYRANRRRADGNDAPRAWDPYLRALPAALVVAMTCVLISRLTNFQPGYLYGLLIGVTAARHLSDAQSARTAAVATVVMLVVAAISWFGLGLVAGGQGWAYVVVQTALVTIMVGGLQGALFGLLPIRYFAGAKMRKWNKWVWSGLLLISGLGFWHVLVNPTSGYLADSSRTPLVTIVALLIFFGLGSVAFWAYFRFRRRPTSTPTPLTGQSAEGGGSAA